MAQGTVPVARCARCDVTKTFAADADRDRWSNAHAEDTQHTVVVWGEPWRPGLNESAYVDVA